jgi:hypothetical protein
MNQMNLMNLLQALCHEKNIFCLLGCLLAGIWCIEVHRPMVLAVFGSFFYIFFILVVTRMNQMYMDEPLSKFKRFFAFWNLTDEPLTSGDFHRGSFGSLRNGGTMSKKVLIVFLALLSWAIAGCGSPMAVQAAPLGTPEAKRSATPAITATATLSPTPTVDWQGTAIVAQATADEARRLDTQATAQEKDRIQEQLAWTAEANQWTAQADQWTATAALTSVPLTATQQAVVNTQVPIDQALMSGQLTATKEAPTQIVAMIDAKNYETYGATDYVVRLFVLGALGVFLLGIGLFALSARNKEDVKPRSAVPSQAVREPDLIQLKPETIVNAKTDYGKGYGIDQVYKVPCSREQLSELAERVIVKGETLGVNNFEGSGTLFTRSVFMRVRNFLQANFMAKSAGAGSGSMILTDKGEAFLRGWLERNELPHSYSFDQKNYEVPLVMSHEHDAHAVAHGGGA